MSASATKAKQKWNEMHYSQIKVSVPKHTAEAYRNKCADLGVSMAGDIIAHMTGEPVCGKAVSAFPVENRKQRRKSAGKLLAMFVTMRNAEEWYMNNIPQNLCGGERYSAAEHAVETLDAIIELVGDIY